MTTIEKITSWEDADHALANLAFCRRELTILGAWRDEAIQTARDDYLRRGALLSERIDELEAELYRFTLAHQEDLEGRSKALTFGRVGFLLVHEVAVRSVKKAVAWLVESRKWAYLRVKHELNKEALREAPPEVLRACGARVRSHDQFWYEHEGQRFTVEG